jgi:hypothetical protein
MSPLVFDGFVVGRYGGVFDFHGTLRQELFESERLSGDPKESNMAETPV